MCCSNFKWFSWFKCHSSSTFQMIPSLLLFSNITFPMITHYDKLYNTDLFVTINIILTEFLLIPHTSFTFGSSTSVYTILSGSPGLNATTALLFKALPSFFCFLIFTVSMITCYNPLYNTDFFVTIERNDNTW
jgi:hypothetical protein